MKKRIKLVQFIHGLSVGGAETVVKNYLSYIDKEKFDITLLCFCRYGTPYEKAVADTGIKIIYMSDKIPTWGKKGIIAKIINHYALFLITKKYIHKLNPNIIHIHLALNRYIKFARPKKGTHIFYTQHFHVHNLESRANRKELNSLKRLIRKYPTDIIALHDNMKSCMAELCGTDAVHVLLNGIDLPKYRKPINISKKRKELGIPEDAFVIIHVGRFHAVKNHDFIIDVFEKIKEKRPEAFLVLVGSGETEDKIRDKVKCKGFAADMLILQNRMDVEDILKVSDAAVFPSLLEGLAIAVIEMQAVGLPVLASDRVPKATKISNRIMYMDVGEPAEKWADMVLEMSDDDAPAIYDNIEKWDIRCAVRQLENLYLNSQE